MPYFFSAILQVQAGGRPVIYAGLPQASVNFLETYLDLGCKIYGGDIHNFVIPDQVLQDIFKALEQIDKLCSGCDGNHSLWVIAGGLVAFLLGKTSTFTDIDIFVNCNKDQLQWESYSVTTLKFENRPSIQIICVNFNINLFHRTVRDLTIWDIFASYVILDFGIPACRCAMKFLSSGCYVMDFSGLKLYSKNIKLRRKKKYLSRMLPHKRLVPTLQQQVLYHIIVKLSSSHKNFSG